MDNLLVSFSIGPSPGLTGSARKTPGRRFAAVRRLQMKACRWFLVIVSAATPSRPALRRSGGKTRQRVARRTPLLSWVHRSAFESAIFWHIAGKRLILPPCLRQGVEARAGDASHKKYWTVSRRMCALGQIRNDARSQSLREVGESW